MAKEKEIKTNAMRLLEKLHIPYKAVQYECGEFTDGVESCKKSGIPVEITYKTLVAEGKSGFYVFVIPVAAGLDLKKAARAVDEKAVSLIHVKDINKITGYIRGGCSPLGMKKDYKTVVDESALKLDEMAVSAGRIGSSVILKPADLIKATRAFLADILA